MATGETREMRLLSMVLHTKTRETLPTFLARRREPGDAYKTWDEILVAIQAKTGEVVGTASLRKWASVYGIPENTRMMAPEDYRKALESADIKI